MVDKKKQNREEEDDIDIKAYKDVGLIPAKFYNKKTGKYMDLETFFASLLSRSSKRDSKKTQKTRDLLIDLYGKVGINSSEKRYLDRIAKAEKKAAMKKVTGPELTTPQKKAKGGYVKKYARGGGVRKVRS
jgi:hypothetical protein|tara:strand:- start:19 stop:411 length:393 start_codon:yes stop_codon:yes gene_type:complete